MNYKQTCRALPGLIPDLQNIVWHYLYDSNRPDPHEIIFYALMFKGCEIFGWNNNHTKYPESEGMIKYCLRTMKKNDIRCYIREIDEVQSDYKIMQRMSRIRNRNQNRMYEKAKMLKLPPFVIPFDALSDEKPPDILSFF